MNDINEFLSQNEKKYEAYKTLVHKLNQLTQESYQNVIHFINKNIDVFFGDHSKAIVFFNLICSSLYNNFIHLEQILDILVEFKKMFIDTKTSEYELLRICMYKYYYSGINYLFMKEFFSLKTIFDLSIVDHYIFINFLPEITEFDEEYAKKRENVFMTVTDPNIHEDLHEFKMVVQSDIKLHIQNRNLNYNPSILHKAIRLDDIDTFTSLLSKNNININHSFKYSYYERFKTGFKTNSSLLEVAVIYRSMKIIKFLLMQPNLYIDDNIIQWAYYSQNYEIIHLFEDKKCRLDDTYLIPLVLSQNYLLKYYIENFHDHIKENDQEVKNELQKYFKEDNNNIYDILTYRDLIISINKFNYKIITKCLDKIVFILKKVELKNNLASFDRYNNSLLEASIFDINLFEFLFNQRQSIVNKYECGSYYNAIFGSLIMNANDVFKFLFNELKDNLNFKVILRLCIKNNHKMGIYLLDLQINEKESKDENSLYNCFKKIIDYNELCLAVEFYNEDIVVKMFQLYSILNSIDDVSDFCSRLAKSISTNMIISLFKRLMSFLPEYKMNCLSYFLKNENSIDLSFLFIKPNISDRQEKISSKHRKDRKRNKKKTLLNF